MKFDFGFYTQGIDNEEEIIIKLGGYAFAGHYEDAVGNIVLFEEKEEKQLQYLCHTMKTLKASRVFLKPNSANATKEDGAGTQ